MSHKRCPLCHVVSRVAWPECQCGYRFGQPVEVVQAELRRRGANAKVELGVAIGALVATIAGSFLLGGFFPVLGVVALIVWIVRVSRRLLMYGDSMRALAAKAPAALPVARVVEPAERS